MQGLASLIDDFHKRKQRLLFYKPRASVLSVLDGVGLEDFVHVSSQEQLDSLLKGWFDLDSLYKLAFCCRKKVFVCLICFINNYFKFIQLS